MRDTQYTTYTGGCMHNLHNFWKTGIWVGALMLVLLLPWLLGCGSSGGGGGSDDTQTTDDGGGVGGTGDDEEIITVPPENFADGDGDACTDCGPEIRVCAVAPELTEATRRAVELWQDGLLAPTYTDVLAPGNRHPVRSIGHELGHYLMNSRVHLVPDACILSGFHDPVRPRLCQEDLDAIPDDAPVLVYTTDTTRAGCEISVDWRTLDDEHPNWSATGTLYASDGSTNWDRIGLNTRWEWYTP